MTLYISADEVRATATHDVALLAARSAVEAEREGLTILPPRLDVDQEHGFLRAMPAAYRDVMGLKIMTLVKGLGTRYLILLYSKTSGELLALLDADEVTRLRTAATTAVAGSILAPDGATRIAVIGSGFEAEGHLRAFAHLWPLEQVSVYSPSAERREAFASRLGAELGLDVRPYEDRAEAVGSAPVVILATKATTPVVDGREFAPGTVVLSIGSTRPDLRELDRGTLQRTARLLVDDPKQVVLESGDVIDGLESGVIDRDRLVGLAAPDVVPGAPGFAAVGPRDLLAFKSVGTALQDLALARAVYEQARQAGRGRELGELTHLKSFAAPAGKAVSAALGRQ